MNGILSINKPGGMTSREAVNLVSTSIHWPGRRGRERMKVGHAGTLDPLATGVLLVCVGTATRLVPIIQEHSKLYRAQFRFGETSDTDDSEGTITRHDVSPPQTTTPIANLLSEFTGRTLQRPPAYSAIRVEGRRAYDLARERQAVDLAPRPVDVYRLDIIDYVPPCLTVEVECGSGTYIRSLARDLGERIGTGALMSELTRLAIGPFRIDDALSMAPHQSPTKDELARHLQPLKAAVTHLSSLSVSASEAELVRNGGRLSWTAERQRSLTAPLTQIPSSAASPAPEPALQSTPQPPPAATDRIAIIEDQADLAAIAELQSHGLGLQPRIVFPQ